MNPTKFSISDLYLRFKNLHQNPAGKSCTEFMSNLKLYLATIQNVDCDTFDAVLDGISRSSGVRPNRRLEAIIPLDRKTIYEVALSDDEALVMNLSCPGEYKFYEEDKRKFMIEYLSLGEP